MNQDLPKLHVVAPTLMTNPVFPEKEKEEKKNKKEASSMTKLEFTACILFQPSTSSSLCPILQPAHCFNVEN